MFKVLDISWESAEEEAVAEAQPSFTRAQGSIFT